MVSWLPSIAYPAPDQPGYWDPVTSTLQWCEEDYYATYYAAEIVNALTNLLFIILAYKGIQSCRKHGHDTVFIVVYLGYLLTGIGSMMFHSTLKYGWQLVDELNMVYTTCLMIYAALSYKQSQAKQFFIGAGLVGLCAFVTAYYHYCQDPTFHQNVYAGLTTFIVIRFIYSMEVALRPAFKVKADRHIHHAHKRKLSYFTERERYENERDYQILIQMWKLVIFSTVVFLSGFALWALDSKYCSSLRSWRRMVGMPWGFFLEGHGWWHLLTGTGVYCAINWCIQLRHVLNGDHERFRLSWPAFYVLPEVVRMSDEQLEAEAAQKKRAASGTRPSEKATSGKVRNGSPRQKV